MASPATTIHYQVKFPETLVKLVVRDRDQAVGRPARLASLDAGDPRAPRHRPVRHRRRQRWSRVVTKPDHRRARPRIATAESCTGGMIGELLTNRVPGMLALAFVGGAITYSNAEKVRQLGVAQATLDAHGAVSEEVVREMAAGARERFGVDIAVAVSGIAGPDGGTPEKPVGTVWLARSGPKGDMTTKLLSWPGARDQIRLLAAWWALKLVDEVLP